MKTILKLLWISHVLIIFYNILLWFVLIPWFSGTHSIFIIRSWQTVAGRQKPSLPLVFVNKTSLEHSYFHSFIYCLWLLYIAMAELSNCDRGVRPFTGKMYWFLLLMIKISKTLTVLKYGISDIKSLALKFCYFLLPKFYSTTSHRRNRIFFFSFNFWLKSSTNIGILR